MQFQRLSLPERARATGTVIVIIDALLTERNPDPTRYLARVAYSPTGKLFLTNKGTSEIGA